MIEPIKRFRSRSVVLPETNIDTDQIIPARFLTTTTSVGLGVHLFQDQRYTEAGELRKDTDLNDERAKACSILVAGRNFGCGSSREHAAWALHDFGFRAVISCEIADIFRANAGNNGIVPVVINETAHQRLLDKPWGEIEIDLEAQYIRPANDDPIDFEIDRFTRYRLLNGIDPLDFILEHAGAIEEYERNLR